MLVVDKPEVLEARALELESSASACDDPIDAGAMRIEARQLRQRAAALRHRRTDGVRFG